MKSEPGSIAPRPLTSEGVCQPRIVNKFLGCRSFVRIESQALFEELLRKLDIFSVELGERF